jgi:exo-beta-1,3-glucanase (GH17 family)
MVSTLGICGALTGACAPRYDGVVETATTGGEGGGRTSAASTTSAGVGTGGAGGSSSVGPGMPPKSNASWVYVQGYQLFVGARRSDGTLPMPAPYKVKGVSWSPMPVGQRNTSGYTPYYTQYASQDGALLAGVHANTVKTYNALEQTARGLEILDELYAQGIMVIMTVLPSYWDAQGNVYLNAVNYFKSHPAILMWALGNELNYNRLYNNAISVDQAVAIVETAIDDIHQADGEHPIAVSWGNLPAANQLSILGRADVWSLNLYPYLDMTSRFDQWAAASKKPIVVGEYGADAWNGKATPPAEDQDAQATATTTLTQQIQAYYSATNPNRPVLGGCIFELADEWFKAAGAGTNPSVHDVGGFANSGVYPDGTSNEEWWGIVTVDRKTRKAYDALRTLYMAP